MKKFCIVLLAASLYLPLCLTAVSQAAPAVAYSPRQLLRIVGQMREQAKNSGNTASGILEKRLDSSTILAFRDKDGQAELHERFEDIFVVLQGNATLLSGGTIANSRATGPGEVRGDSVREGTRSKLSEGDIVHIPADTPHQLLVGPGSTFAYFIVKVPRK